MQPAMWPMGQSLGRLSMPNRLFEEDLESYVKSLKPAVWCRYGRGITVTGAGVAVWADVSGNARDLLQGTDANRPPLQADNSILFDGVAHFLKCGAFALVQPETVYILGKHITWTTDDRVFDGEALNSMTMTQTGASPNVNLFATDGAAVADNAVWVLDTYAAVASVFAPTAIVQVNNGAPTSGALGTGNGGGFTLGARGDLSRFCNMQMKEILVFAAALDQAARRGVARYLARVGGLAI